MNFNTIVVGAGPGGYELAATLADNGQNVALVEREHLGGTCLNCGCIPTKALCHGAEHGKTLEEIHEHTARVLPTLREGIKQKLAGMTLISGDASFNPDGTLTVTNAQGHSQTLTATNTVIATGSVPAPLHIPGAEHAIDSTQLLNITAIPRHLCIIGGGVIGMEMASAWHNLGAQVTVVEYAPEILPVLDADMARRLRSEMQRRGIKIQTAARVTELKKLPDGTLQVDYVAKNRPQSLEVTHVLSAVGRKARLPEGLAETGIDISSRGAICISPDCKTTHPGIFAIGDCTEGTPMLAHAASAQAKFLAGKLLGKPANFPQWNTIPSVIFTQPPVFQVGMTEEKAKKVASEEFAEMEVYKKPITSNGYAMATGASGLLKTVCIDSRIKGMQYIGPEAPTLVAPAVMAVQGRMAYGVFDNFIFPHPTLTELFYE